MNCHFSKTIADSSSGCVITITQDMDLSTSEEIDLAKKEFLSKIPDNSLISKQDETPGNS